jgi:class 3 adenylate cyclase/TolB-like protein/Tfp pilus assembly protein PilF
MERKLVAILAADVAGYSRLMESDETGTLAALTSHRNDLIDPKIAEHHGHVVKLMGDGALVEFASVVDALQCAVDIQRGMDERNRDVPVDEQIRFRIGVHLGDVIVEGEDIYGDGVNVASRIEALAEPGGICVSRQAKDQIGSKIQIGFESLGARQVKNLETPIEVYRVVLDGKPGVRTPLPNRRLVRFGVAAAVAVALIVGVSQLLEPAPTFEPASAEAMAFPLPEEPSIAVLPFADLTGDPERAVLVDGITDSIITTLSRAPDLFVIDRGSSHVYDGKVASIKEVAEDLGVRFVLQGGIQVSGERLRINVQLNDALTGRTIWANDFDNDLSDMFAVQDEVTSAVLSELEVNLSQGEQARIRRRQTESVDAYLYFLQGLEHHHIFSAGEQTAAQKLLQKAIEIDPEFASARAYLGFTYIKQARLKWVPDIAEARRVGEAHIRKAIEIDPDNVDAIKMLGDVYFDAGDREQTLALQQRALALEPNHADNLATHSYTLAMSGRPAEGLPLIKRAMRLSPNYPSGYLSALAWCEFFLGNYDAAIEANEARRLIIPNSELPMIYLVIMYSAAGRMQEAGEMVAKLRAVVPGYRISNFKTLAGGWFPPDTFEQIKDYMVTAGIENDLDG